MIDSSVSLSKLYYNYKKRSSEEISKYLNKIDLVILQDKGIGTIKGYYPLIEEEKEKILNNPRGVSINFNTWKTENTPLSLKEYKTIIFLVKSSSRFFLKADIGEVIDQIDFNDYYSSDIKAIYVEDGYIELDGTEGEHFLMNAKLLKQ